MGGVSRGAARVNPVLHFRLLEDNRYAGLAMPYFAGPISPSPEIRFGAGAEGQEVVSYLKAKAMAGCG
jgi:hypothetical protein